jgi:toxin secretion/phage lysis holin
MKYEILLHFNTTGVKLLMLIIVMDIVFGVIRALKERKINSTIGIDGMIRKVSMITAMLFLVGIDLLVPIDLICFIPEPVKDYLNFDRVGIDSLFSILFITFESLSVLKNMIKCELPIPRKLQDFLEKIMKEYTDEIKINESEEK